MIVGGIAIAFWRGASLAAICFCFLPFFFCTVFIFGSVTKKAQGEKLKQLEMLGGHTEETLTAIKLVISFAQEGITLADYDKIAKETNKIAKKAAIL